MMHIFGRLERRKNCRADCRPSSTKRICEIWLYGVFSLYVHASEGTKGHLTRRVSRMRDAMITFMLTKF